MKKEIKQAEEPVKKKKQSDTAVPLAERISSYCCPTLLGAVLCFIVIYALYRPLALQYTAIFFCEELLLFTFFDKLKNRKVLGGLIYMMIMVAVVFFSIYLMFSGATSSGSPVTWFYGEEGTNSYRPEFLNAVFIGGGFFMISILYYFTQIRYRSLGVMLCLLFPLVIYAKRAEELPEILVTIMISLFLAVMVHNRRIDPAIERKRRGVLVTNTAYIISMAIFVSVTGAVTMMIEKPTYFSKLERDSSYFDYYQTSGTGSGDFEDTSNQSSPRAAGLQYTNNPIFNFETTSTANEFFLRRQVFDQYKGDVWELSEYQKDYSIVYSSVVPEYGIDDIIYDMKTVSQESEDFAAPNVQRILQKKTGRIYDDTFAPRYLPAPIGVITDTDELNKIPYRKYPGSVVYRAKSFVGDNQKAIDDRFDFWEQSDALYTYASTLGMDGSTYRKKLTKLSESKNASEEAVKAAKRLLLQYDEAYENYRDISKVQDRLVELAYDITKDCKSDLEKAYRLEQYFELHAYKYSLEYVPDDNSIEYFVFESKTGYCASYATAMTLMARAVDLPARYVEGFAAFERSGEDGNFIVRDGHAHAFVEVYIPGAGWLTFDPTVSDYKAIDEEQAGGFDFDMFLRILSRFVVVIVVGFVVIFIVLLDRIIEMIFRLRLKFADPAKKTLMLYANVIKLVNFSTKEDYSAYTVKMLRKYLDETRSLVPEVLFDLFERTAFGGHDPSEQEFKAAYDDYKSCYKYLRRLPRPKELAKLKGIPYVKTKN